MPASIASVYMSSPESAPRQRKEPKFRHIVSGGSDGVVPGLIQNVRTGQVLRLDAVRGWVGVRK